MGLKPDEQKKLDELEKANLKEKINIEEANKDRQRRLKEALEKGQQNVIQKMTAMQDLYRKTKEKTNKAYAQVNKSVQDPDRQNSMHTSSLASMIMDMSPRFEHLMNFIIGKSTEAIRYTSMHGLGTEEYIEDMGILHPTPWPAASTMYFHLCNYFRNEKKEFDIPDLKYFANMGEQGELTLDWASDYIKDFMIQRNAIGEPELDPNGNKIVNKEKSALFQCELQRALMDWLQENEYFVGPQEADGQFRVYPQRVGIKQSDNTWALNPTLVHNRYELTDCTNGMPNPNAVPKNNMKPLHISAEEFYTLRDNPDHSFAKFLDTKFEGLDLELEQSNSFRP